MPLLDGDCSMGMFSDRSQFWLNLDLDHQAIQSIRLKMTPWNPAMSTAREATATYLGSLLRHSPFTRHQNEWNHRWQRGHWYSLLPKGLRSSTRAYHGIGAYCTFPMGRTDWFLPHLAPTIPVEILKHGEDAM